MRIREATSDEDLNEAALIQREVWNVQDIDIVGPIEMKALQHAGASVLLAEMDDGAVAGFSYAFPAFVKGETFWHSDLLAVRPAYRGGQVGQRLKWAQRDHALSRGIKRITWTFDPMQAGNANLNLEWLGATAGEYLPNFYGVTTSALHHGLPTDRLLASWELESPRVAARAHGAPRATEAREASVAIPDAWNDLVKRDPEKARQEQRRVASEIQSALGQGLVITGFDKAASSYVFSRPERA